MWKGLGGGGHFPVVGPLATPMTFFAPWSTTNPIVGSLLARERVAAVDKSWLSSGCKDGISPDSLSGGQHHAPFVEGFSGVNEVFLCLSKLGNTLSLLTRNSA